MVPGLQSPALKYKVYKEISFKSENETYTGNGNNTGLAVLSPTTI